MITSAALKCIVLVFSFRSNGVQNTTPSESHQFNTRQEATQYSYTALNAYGATGARVQVRCSLR